MDITIRDLTTHDEKYFSDGIELLNRTQGRDLFSKDYLHQKTNDPNAKIFAAFDGDILISLGIAQIIDNYDYYLPFVPEIYEQFKNKKVGSFSTLCTHEDYQGQGIGKKISHKRLAWLKDQKCDVIVGVSWVSGLSHTSDRVFEKVGFKAIKRVDKFYINQSIEHPFDCPGCKIAPCQCSAILYKMDL